MTILTLNKKELEKKVGKITPELEKKITDMGTPIEEVTDDELSVEVFPNRPDLLSLENFARAVNQFNGKEKIATFKVYPPEKEFLVTIDKSVKSVRPYCVCAVVKGLKFDDAKIKSIVNLQEKLHNSIGRKRRKVAIGIYPLEKIKLPIRFVGKSIKEIQFLPLGSDVKMSAIEILKKHPAGKEYAHLLKDAQIFPIFLDAGDEVLSMPPIINSEKSGRVDKNTRDIFIECSGSNLAYLEKTLNILIASISEMGGKVYGVRVRDDSSERYSKLKNAIMGKSRVYPNMSFEELEFKIKDIEKTLGISLKEKSIKDYLSKTGIGYENKKGKSVALIPPYRTDILHWIDLAEEVAIAYGYDNFEPEIPNISTTAEENAEDKTKRAIGNILAGLGLLECSSFHLTTKKNIKKIHYDFNKFIEVENSKTERDVLRMDLMTNLLQILSENSNVAYPQKVFEMGRVFELHESSETGVVEKERLAIAMSDEKIGYTEMKQILDYLFKMLNLNFEVIASDSSNYILGRCGKIIVNGKEIGEIGEIAPRVLRNWKIHLPVVGCELEMESLFL